MVEKSVDETDPWNEIQSGNDIQIQVGFNDNFIDKLPDSAEYLSRLESKLSKIKKGSLRKSRNMKEEYISQLLMNSNGTENGIDFIESADIETSPVISKIQPIQAINTLELQHLIPTTTSSENEELKFEDEKNESS
ncbi:uncharacterized protein [Lepeophtheirus salmonis]|uniref:Uncharacterized protein n=1 Tax=Lepeophtheirus salmonis TaxID=72036 RepID=A0A0K2UGI5_LEPSM